MADSEQNGLLQRTRAGPEAKATAPALLKYRSSKAFILATICLALFTDSFIYGALVPVLPFMLKDRSHIRDGTEQLWTSAMFAAYGIAILVGSPICGYFADRSTSRRLPLLLGLPVLAGATALIGISTSVWVLLLSRLFQGFSTAVTWTVGLALTRDTAGTAEVGQWMGTALSSSSVGLIISPLLGGIVFDATGIWGVLGMMIGLIVLNVFFITGMVERRVAERYDIIDADADDAGEQYGTFPVFEDAVFERTKSSGSAEVDAGSIDTSNGFTSFGDLAGRQAEADDAKKPLTPPMLLLLRSPRVLAGVYGVFTQFGMLASFDAFLPLFVEGRFGWGSLGAGLIFLNIAIPALLGPLAGKISDRYGPRRVALVGCIFTAPPLFLLRLVDENTRQQIILLCALLVVAGVFLTLIISPLAADISFAVDEMEIKDPGCFGDKGAYAQAYALFNCSMAAACVVGPLLTGALEQRYGAAGVSLMLAIWCISAAVPVFFFIGDGDFMAPAEDVEQPMPRRIEIDQLMPHRMSVSQAFPHRVSISNPFPRRPSSSQSTAFRASEE